MGNYFHKGDRVTITDHIQTGSYEDQQGQRTYATDVVIDSFNFVESNSSSGTANQGYNSPADLDVSDQESFDNELPF